MRTAIVGRHIAAGLFAAFALLACTRQADAPGEAIPQSAEAQRQAQLTAALRTSLGAPADSAARALYEGEFQASGSIDALGAGEGAWELLLLNDYAQFVRPGLGPDGGIPQTREYFAQGMLVTAGPLTISLSVGDCALPTGVTLPYSAEVLFEGVAYKGCARKGVPEGDRPTWASVVAELLPAIDACLARVTAAPARVTTASARAENEVSVRIREADGTRRECLAAADGSAAPTYDLLSPIDQSAGEGFPEFLRGEDDYAPGACERAEEAKNADGARIGWLIFKTC